MSKYFEKLSLVIMAPEVYQGRTYEEKCDIYSWSIVFWQLLAKKYSPYEDQTINTFGKISIETYTWIEFIFV
jgi:hypothetical protein